jgi:alanine racemase
MKTRYRKTVAKINLIHLYENYKNVQNKVGDKIVIPVVKANAYGHGVLEVVDYLYKKGIDYFAVSLLEEALEIRELFPDVGLLCMGIIEDDGLLIASENNITVTMSNFDQLSYVRKLDKALTIHFKVDTGMNRLGFKSNEEILQAFEILHEHPKIFIEGLYTHFSTADENKKYYDFQFDRFLEIKNLLPYDFPMIHISNSSSQIKYEWNYDFTTHTRLGISLYGLTTDNSTTFLKNTFQLVTSISQIKKLAPGDNVGYGATYTATGHELIGILPIGYADGFIRKNTGGDVEINGKRYPIVGRICMDQSFIKIDSSITKEDEVILFGGLISIDEVATRLDTINYEIICDITARVPREYIK